MSTETINTPSTDNKIFLNGKQLAEVLGVSAPTVTEAVKNGWNCGGYPVGEWAIESKTGRIKGYDVPEFIVSGDQQEEKRPNPSPLSANSTLIAANNNKKGANNAQSVTNNYSLLPEGEDYVRPIGMITLPSVLKKALEQDTPQSRAIIAGGLAALGALVGHAVTDKATGAGVGAGTGLAIALLVYKNFNPSIDGQLLDIDMNQFTNQKRIPMEKSLPKLSRYSTN